MMGHRTVKRVPLDFDWPLGERWKGYIDSPEGAWPECPECHGDGQTPEARAVSEAFYAFGCPEPVRWCDKLGQAEVDNLIERGRLSIWTPGENGERGHWEQRPRTAAEVNALNRRGGLDSHDAINRWYAVQFRCEQLGIEEECSRCGGHGNIATAEERAAAGAWEPTDPPAGDGWQLWETTSEGSPASPVFASADELAGWCERNATPFADFRWTSQQWLESFDAGSTDVDTLLIVRSEA